MVIVSLINTEWAVHNRLFFVNVRDLYLQQYYAVLIDNVCSVRCQWSVDRVEHGTYHLDDVWAITASRQAVSYCMLDHHGPVVVRTQSDSLHTTN